MYNNTSLPPDSSGTSVDEELQYRESRSKLMCWVHSTHSVHPTQNKTSKTADAGTGWPWISKWELSSISLISFWTPVRFTIYRSQTTLALFPLAILSTPSHTVTAPSQFVWVLLGKLASILLPVVDKDKRTKATRSSANLLDRNALSPHTHKLCKQKVINWSKF